ncbi:MAG: hypothetical protein OEW48_09765 [Phycisphaerae bacterium]|nr:hypothetical protein [Phycisphaerae bacterium]
MITAKRQLLSVLILVVICVSAPATEPNETKTELKFEISKRLGSTRLRKFAGPVKPKYVAIFSMSDLSQISRELDVHRDYPALTKMILATSAGKSMSEIQKELLKEDRVISTETSFVKDQMYNVEETEFGLYAFTVEDAKNITQALIEVLTKIAREKQPPMLDEFINKRKQKLQEYQERIADTKKKLSEKEPELKPTETAYKTLKNTDHYKTLADTEAYEKAKETITQMNKMLSILEIELSGIQEKLVVIEKYRESDKFSKATLEKLEQMFVEQMVELRGAMGRKEAALKLRNQDKQFCDLYNQWTGLESEVKSLRNSLGSFENRVLSYEEEIANPHPQLLPPKVLQNKVTIYPL